MGYFDSFQEATVDSLSQDTPSSSETNPAELALEIHNILFPHSSDIRRRVIQSAMTLLGESSVGQFPGSGASAAPGSAAPDDFQDLKLGPKALRWLTRNGISRAMLDEVFHISEDTVFISADNVPGVGRKEKTINCYLLCGARGLLQGDVPSFDDGAAITECQRLAAYDKNNHTTYRAAIGNKMTGKKPNLMLTGPGETAAADLVKQMAPARNV